MQRVSEVELQVPAFSKAQVQSGDRDSVSLLPSQHQPPSNQFKKSHHSNPDLFPKFGSREVCGSTFVLSQAQFPFLPRNHPFFHIAKGSTMLCLFALTNTTSKTNYWYKST
jgi:hypothetical protein